MSTTSTGPLGPPISAWGSARSDVSPACCSEGSAVSESVWSMRTRRIPALFLAVLAAGALLAGCSNAEGDVHDAAQKFLTAWSGGHLATAAQATTDAPAADALLKRTAADLRGATLTASVGKVTVNGKSATVGWQATWPLPAAPDWHYGGPLKRHDASGWKVMAEPAMVHPGLAAGQHLVEVRSLPERAAITDA